MKKLLLLAPLFLWGCVMNPNLPKDSGYDQLNSATKSSLVKGEWRYNSGAQEYRARSTPLDSPKAVIKVFDDGLLFHFYQNVDSADCLERNDLIIFVNSQAIKTGVTCKSVYGTLRNAYMAMTAEGYQYLINVFSEGGYVKVSFPNLDQVSYINADKFDATWEPLVDKYYADREEKAEAQKRLKDNEELIQQQHESAL